MYTYDAITKTGIQIHLSMTKNNTCYIFVNDIYNNTAYLKKVVEQGKEKAHESANKTITEVREIIGFKPF